MGKNGDVRVLSIGTFSAVWSTQTALTNQKASKEYIKETDALWGKMANKQEAHKESVEAFILISSQDDMFIFRHKSMLPIKCYFAMAQQFLYSSVNAQN